jgi:hypothetical protein
MCFIIKIKKNLFISFAEIALKDVVANILLQGLKSLTQYKLLLLIFTQKILKYLIISYLNFSSILLLTQLISKHFKELFN